MKNIWMGVAAVAALGMGVVLTVSGGHAGAAELGMPAATYVEAQAVLDHFGKTPNAIVPANGQGYEVQTNRRNKDGNIEIHNKETDIFYVTDGSATILVGGNAVEPKATKGQNMTAKDMTDYQTYNLKKGDVLVIPAGQPHWFKKVNGSIDYLVVKHIKP